MYAMRSRPREPDRRRPRPGRRHHADHRGDGGYALVRRRGWTGGLTAAPQSVRFVHRECTEAPQLDPEPKVGLRCDADCAHTSHYTTQNSLPSGSAMRTWSGWPSWSYVQITLAPASVN